MHKCTHVFFYTIIRNNQFFMREHFYLSPKYNNGQTVYKSHHHWMWNQSNKTTKFEYTSCYLNNTHQDHTSHEVEEAHVLYRLIKEHSFGVTISIIVTKITATAPAAPEINPGLPPKIAATKPTIKAPVSAISGSICATKAKATTSGIIANDTVTPLRISFFGLVVNLG